MVGSVVDSAGSRDLVGSVVDSTSVRTVVVDGAGSR